MSRPEGRRPLFSLMKSGVCGNPIARRRAPLSAANFVKRLVPRWSKRVMASLFSSVKKTACSPSSWTRVKPAALAVSEMAAHNLSLQTKYKGPSDADACSSFISGSSSSSSSCSSSDVSSSTGAAALEAAATAGIELWRGGLAGDNGDRPGACPSSRARPW